MLTKADDYPIHQTPEPIAYSGTDRNFYDRYFFNGYQRDGDLFFAAAMGIYPHLNVMDAAFCIIANGKQYNVHASKTLHMERLDTRVGPIEIEVIEPLNILRIAVNDPDHGIHADLIFNARFPAIEEPRFIRRVGSITAMDYTRLTQNGTYEGYFEVAGERCEVGRDNWWGTRDRSWGIRSIGLRDPQANPYGGTPQFFWLWSPLNFEDSATFYHLNADASGEPWNTRGRLISEAVDEELTDVSSELTYLSGTRYAQNATIAMTRSNGQRLKLTLTPQKNFYMRGLGYTHPEWGHGLYHGELASGFEVYELDDIDPADPAYFHIQAICAVELDADGQVSTGKGVLEQFVIGAYEPYGFKDLLDVAP